MTSSQPPSATDLFARTVADALSRAHLDTGVVPGSGAAASPPRLDAPALSRRLGLVDAVDDRFRIRELLGAGGIGRVLLVEDRNLHREIAIKTPLPAQAMDPSALEAFVTEARVTASLEHPGIAPVHDLDLSSDGQIYYAMRRVHGRTLGSFIGEALESGRRPAEIAGPNELVTIFLKVCDALSYAHARGVVHRDLKPDNIMLGSFGEVLVLDWGASSSGTSSHGNQGLFGTPAFMSPEQARREPLGASSDVWSLGATLYQALLLRFPLSMEDDDRFWERRCRGELDLPRITDLAPAERPLLAIAARAMAADPGQRYASMSALADDLRAYQSGQAMAAWRGSWFDRVRRWHRAWGRTLWTACVMVLTLAAAGWFVWGERLKEVATWGRPMLTERFADDSWKDRWEAASGAFDVRDGRLLSTAPGPAIARLRIRVAPPVAIEFEGEMTPGSSPCDLSVVYFAAPQERPGAFPTDGWALKAGAFDNTYCAIVRSENGHGSTVAQHPLRLVTGRKHRIRAEIDGATLTLKVDGAVVSTYTDSLPIPPGWLALYGFYAGKAFADVRVYRKGEAQRISPIAIGDDRLRTGQYDLAIERYQNVLASHPEGELADEAWYRIGYCHRLAGHEEAAWAAWRNVAHPPLSDRVLCQDLDRLFSFGKHDEVLQRLPAVASRSAICRSQCEGLWTDWVEQLLDAPGGSVLADYCAIRKRVFPEEGPSVRTYGRALIRLKRYEEVLAECGEEPMVVPMALVHLGRADEAVARFGQLPWQAGQLRWQAGDLATTISSPSEGARPDIRPQCMAKAGRLAEAQREYGGHPPPWLQVAAGDWAGLLARRTGGEEEALALIATGRIAEAADGRQAQPATPSTLALVLLGRLDEAERIDSGLANLPTLHLLAALAAGRMDEVQRAGPAVAQAQVDWGEEDGWFGPCVLCPFLAQLSGDRQAWPTALAFAMERKGRAGQRLWHLAGFLAGRLGEAEVRAQPFAAEADAWLCLAQGMRADVNGNRAEAQERYRAFAALPLEKRLLDGFRPSAVVERFVAWRLRN